MHYVAKCANVIVSCTLDSQPVDNEINVIHHRIPVKKPVSFSSSALNLTYCVEQLKICPWDKTLNPHITRWKAVK